MNIRIVLSSVSHLHLYSGSIAAVYSGVSDRGPDGYSLWLLRGLRGSCGCSACAVLACGTFVTD